MKRTLLAALFILLLVFPGCQYTRGYTIEDLLTEGYGYILTGLEYEMTPEDAFAKLNVKVPEQPIVTRTPEGQRFVTYSVSGMTLSGKTIDLQLGFLEEALAHCRFALTEKENLEADFAQLKSQLEEKWKLDGPRSVENLVLPDKTRYAQQDVYTCNLSGAVESQLSLAKYLEMKDGNLIAARVEIELTSLGIASV